MKYSFAVLFLLFSFQVFAQPTVTERFQKIGTVQEAQQYIDANPALKPTLLKLSYGKDSTLIEKRLLRQNKGDIFSVGYVTYKVLEAAETVNYRASYIFLDGGSLSINEIDSLKKLIVQKANAGTPFDKLSDEYTMDGNTTHGDTGWFSTILVFIIIWYVLGKCGNDNTTNRQTVPSNGSISRPNTNQTILASTTHHYNK